MAAATENELKEISRLAHLSRLFLSLQVSLFLRPQFNAAKLSKSPFTASAPPPLGLS